ncbi:hypothetical protein B0H14DRAFT_2390991, partial [Mycena olivaceomarginata]
LSSVGTVLGFAVSYRTTSSFERYDECRRLWSQIILASRTFAHIVWFHVPDLPAMKEMDAESLTARGMVEKKTIINLLEAYGVAVNYLRGGDGIYYQDLYYLVKFLPAYTLPPGIPSNVDLTNAAATLQAAAPPCPRTSLTPLPRRTSAPTAPRSARARARSCSLLNRHQVDVRAAPAPARDPPRGARHTSLSFAKSVRSMKSLRSIKSPGAGEPQKIMLARADEVFLLPGSLPPKYHLFDLFPFSLLVRCLTKRGAEIKGKKAARIRAKMLKVGDEGSHNLPLEISLYLLVYIAAVQKRKQADVPTITDELAQTLIAALNHFVDALTGLERILTTPIPLSYSIHLWVVTTIYCLCSVRPFSPSFLFCFLFAKWHVDWTGRDLSSPCGAAGRRHRWDLAGIPIGAYTRYA